MSANIFQIQNCIHTLNMSFSNSFFEQIRNQYQVNFKNSNVVDEMETLNELQTMLSRQAIIRKTEFAGPAKDLKLIECIIEYYTTCINTYKQIFTVTTLSPKLKRYDMLKDLLTCCQQQEPELTGANKRLMDKLERVHEIIKPDVKGKKLTDKEYAKAKVQAIMAKRALRENNS